MDLFIHSPNTTSWHSAQVVNQRDNSTFFMIMYIVLQSQIQMAHLLLLYMIVISLNWFHLLFKEQLFMYMFSFVFIQDFKVIISLQTDVGSYVNGK
jgi:hypothetical protein